MANLDYQRHTFLGGEVSPQLYERVDMDKFSRWFSKAENIRFIETGGFKARNGFVKVADTKAVAGTIIKLLSFSFNDEQSFLVELGDEYARFYKDGKPIIVNNAHYEIRTPFLNFAQEDIKYTQSGDIIFIVHPQFGIYELSREKKDGTEWKLKKFKTDIFPMKEENEDEGLNISAAASTVSDVATLTLVNPLSTYSVRNPKLIDITIPSTPVEVYSYTGTRSFNELVAGINSAFNTQSLNFSASLNGNTISIVPTSSDPVPQYKLTYDYMKDVEVPYDVNAGSATYTFPEDTIYCSKLYLRYEFLQGLRPRMYYSETFIPSTTTTLEASLSSISSQYEYFSNTSNSITFSGHPLVFIIHFNAYYRKWEYAEGTFETEGAGYLLTANDNSIFADVEAGETILIKHYVDSGKLYDHYNSSTTSSAIGPSDGNYSWYTSGNWEGHYDLEYSIDKTNWIKFLSIGSDRKDAAHNVTTAGKIEEDELVYFRVNSTITGLGDDPWFRFELRYNSYAVNSYYKILSKPTATTALAKCIKNDIGTFSSNSHFRKPAFSNKEGWPQTVAFYQNRLFFGKDYTVYGSRSNHYWDFYEPIKVQDDDPITMSLLSQKVNSVQNLVTQRSFFTFTKGGEFGIASEGALTQKDKYLKQFSSNGSAKCLPVLTADVVLFVDKSENTVRSLKYALENDGYEAPDVSITLKDLLKNEKIISTDVIFEDKECLFLSETGKIWVLKYIADQNVISWSHWQHATAPVGKITNICVVPNGAKHDLYIAIENSSSKWIEKIDRDEYMDTVENYEATTDAKVPVSGIEGDTKVILQQIRNLDENDTKVRWKKYVRKIENVDGVLKITAPDDTTMPFKVGSAYTSTATLLSPVVETSNYTASNYEKKVPFKVFFYYLNSYGFKVGVEEDEKMDIEWQQPTAAIDESSQLTTGKNYVLIPSSFNGSARVSFVQNEPFPMEVCDVLIQTDHGGK